MLIRTEDDRWPNTPRVAFEWNLGDSAASRGKAMGQQVVEAEAADYAAQLPAEIQAHRLAFEAHFLPPREKAFHRQRC